MSNPTDTESEYREPQNRHSLRTTLLALGIVGGSYALKIYLMTRARLEFGGKSVVITGGSRGLGLELARLFAADGANVALLARDGDELGRARDELLSIAPQSQVLSVVCDVTSSDAINDAVQHITQRFGAIDVLVNVAGIIQVGPLEHMSLQDFDDTININLRGPLAMTLACLPYLKRAARDNAGRGGARIVNIASIGGLVALPHMAPYTTSKFGLVGFSNAIRAELAKDGVRVLTVCPSTMRTGSHVHAMFKGRHELEYTAFAALSSAPVITMEGPAAARAIYEAAQRGVDNLVLPGAARLMAIGAGWLPNVTAVISKLIARFMPPPTDAAGDELKTGAQSRSQTPAALTRAADAAAQHNNETESASLEVESATVVHLNGSHPTSLPETHHNGNA